jgi:HK97 family phage major capsid protein
MDRTALLEEKNTSLKAARDIAAKAEDENRSFTAEERGQVTAYMEKAKAAHNSILELDGDAKMLEDLNALGRPIGELAKSGGITLDQGPASLGERFTKAPEFVDWLKSVAGSAGVISDGMKGFRSPAYEFGGLKGLRGQKAVVTGLSDTSAGAVVQNQWLGLQDLGTFQRPLTVRQLVTNGTTQSDAVEYARVTGFTNAAAPVAEATTAAGATAPEAAGALVLPAGSGVKPESSMVLEKVITNVKTIAHWIPATKRALSDASQIRTLIDNFLEYGLEEELEDQIITGDGTGENFEGILDVSGTQAQAWDTSIFVTARKAKRKVRTVGRATASAYLLNPEDNERIDLALDGNQRFYGNGPFGIGPDVLWGLPRVESEAVPVGTGIVGDFRQAVLWDREQSGIQVSDSHADFFIRNLVAILAEMRAAFGILRPKAFVIMDLTA